MSVRSEVEDPVRVEHPGGAAVEDPVRVVALWTALGAGLRFFELGAQSLWLDELFSVFVARRELAQVLTGSALGDTNPPLFNVLLHFALMLGADETAARLVSALFSVATIPLFYLVARRLFQSRAAANVAAALLALSPFHLAYAQEARMYAQLAFFQLAALYLFQRAWSDNRPSGMFHPSGTFRWRHWLAFALVETLAFYSHSLAALGLLALDIFALWRWREARARWRGLAGAHLLIALAFAPWVLFLSQQVGRVLRGFWNPPSTVLELVSTIYVFVFGAALPTLLVPVGLVVTLFLFVLALYQALRALAVEAPQPTERQALQLTLCVALVPPVALLLLSLLRPVYIERVLISSSFGLYLLWAWAWTRRARLFDRIVIAVGAVLVVVALYSYYPYRIFDPYRMFHLDPGVQKPPMRDAAQGLSAQYRAGDVVIHTSDWTALAFEYYAPQIPQRFLAGDPAYVNETTRGQTGLVVGLQPKAREELVADHARIWLVVALDHSEEYQQRRVDEFAALYVLQEQVEVNGIYLLLFRQKEK